VVILEIALPSQDQTVILAITFTERYRYDYRKPRCADPYTVPINSVVIFEAALRILEGVKNVVILKVVALLSIHDQSVILAITFTDRYGYD
jgi:hypothetical protein